MRFLPSAICSISALLFFCYDSSAQTTVFEYSGYPTAASLGDINGDGFPDIVKGASAGYVQVVSLYDGSILRQSSDPTNSTSGFGSAVASAGDADGDGRRDYVVGEWNEDVPGVGTAGAVHVFSSATGAPLVTLQGTQNYGRFGRSVAGMSDSANRFIVGAPYEAVVGTSTCPNCTAYYAGVVYLYSSNGSQLFRIVSPLPGNNRYFGSSVSSAGDVNGDAVEDLLIGELSGAVHLFDGASANLIRTHNPSYGPSVFGQTVGVVGDITGDSLSEYIIGGPKYGATGQPELHVVNGATGAYIFSFTSTPPHVSDGSFAASANGVGDITGDGVRDFAIGSGQTISLYSGSTGAIVGVVYDQGSYGIYPVGDFNLDGRADYMAGASGTVRVYSSLTLPTAQANQIGSSCGGFGSTFAFHGYTNSPPKLGGVFRVRAQQKPGISLAILALSVGAPMSLPFSPGCTIYADPSAVLVAPILGSLASNSITYDIVLPNIPTLAGMSLTAQLVGVETGGAIALSNGLAATLGY